MALSLLSISSGKRKIDTKDPGILFHFANQFLPFISQDNSDYVVDKLGDLRSTPALTLTPTRASSYQLRPRWYQPPGG